MKKFFEEIALIWRIDWVSGLLIFINPLLQSTLPFFPVIFGANIVNLLLADAALSTIMVQVYWMTGLTFVFSLAYAFTSMMFDRRQNTLYFEFSQEIINKGLSLPYSYLDSEQCKDLLRKAHDSNNMFGGIGNLASNMSSLVQSLVSLAYSVILFNAVLSAGIYDPSKADGSLGYAFLANPWSTALVIGVVIVSVFITLLGSLILNIYFVKAMDKMQDSNRMFGVLVNILEDPKRGKDIRIFGMKEGMTKAMALTDESFNKALFPMKGKAGISTLVTTFASLLLVLAAYLFYGFQAWYGIISIGSILIAAGAVTGLSSALNTMVSSAVNLVPGVKAIGYYLDFLKVKPQESGTEKVEGLTRPYVFSFNHVWFKYPNSAEWALEDVSFTIKPGTKMAVVGRNGAGKSTIVKLLTRFYEPTKGNITINGKDIESFDFAEYQKVIAVVFQDFTIFDYTIGENVAGSQEEDKDRMDQDLKIAGVYDRIQSLPKKEDTYCNTRLSKDGILFSGGESQKIAIARALYKDSPLIALDEPTSALDPMAEQEIYNSFGSLVEGKTSVFISHRMSSTRFCDRIIVIDKGKLVEDGTHDSLMKIPNGIYRRMFEAQAQYYR